MASTNSHINTSLDPIASELTIYPRASHASKKYAFVWWLTEIFPQVNEASTTMGSPGEQLSRRCVSLLKTALRPDIWPNSELKLAWFDKILMTVESHQPNFANICTALELLSFLLQILVRGACSEWFTNSVNTCYIRWFEWISIQ